MIMVKISERYIQYAMVSFGYGDCGRTGRPGAYTKIAHAEILPWLYRQIDHFTQQTDHSNPNPIMVTAGKFQINYPYTYSDLNTCLDNNDREVSEFSTE